MKKRVRRILQTALVPSAPGTNAKESTEPAAVADVLQDATAFFLTTEGFMSGGYIRATGIPSTGEDDFASATRYGRLPRQPHPDACPDFLNTFPIVIADAAS
jgi:hypothetical protein